VRTVRRRRHRDAAADGLGHWHARRQGEGRLAGKAQAGLVCGAPSAQETERDRKQNEVERAHASGGKVGQRGPRSDPHVAAHHVHLARSVPTSSPSAE
jgi:hypothetical protein